MHACQGLNQLQIFNFSVVVAPIRWLLEPKTTNTSCKITYDLLKIRPRSWVD